MTQITPSKRESTGDRRQAIAMAARALIAEKGMEGLRTRDIADRVGINIATLHYHVPTKEALIGLVTETLRQDFRAQSLVRPREHLSPSERLEHEFFDFWELVTEQPEVLALMSELHERARRDPLVRDAVMPMMRYWEQMVADILAAGRDDGSFRPNLDPDAGAIMVIGAMMGLCRNRDCSSDTFERLCAELRRALANPTSSKD